MSVDFNDRVVNINVDVVVGVMGNQRGVGTQAGQGAGGDGIELANMAEGECPQEGTQGRGRVSAGEERVHAAVAQQGHVVDGIGTGDHSRYQRGHLRSCIGAFVCGHGEVFVGQSVETGCVGEVEDREQAGCRHEVRVVEGRGYCCWSVRDFHLRDAP